MPQFVQGQLFAARERPDVYRGTAAALRAELRAFREFGTATRELSAETALPVYVNEFWTSRQRAASSLHEVSYRACFKPQLPRFFIERLTRPGATVYDPFMGRGTTVLEAALLGRRPIGCDVNPLSRVLIEPRLAPPALPEVEARLRSLELDAAGDPPAELLAFYHPETLREICALRAWLMRRRDAGALDPVDRWIRMVAVNRLTGHSRGFFSVYTLPPNQAVSVRAQLRINERRAQCPPRRDVRALILRKSRALLADCDARVLATLRAVEPEALLLTAASAGTPEIASGSVALVVTSPPFLDVVQYAQDNWLRCWFCGIDAAAVPIALHGALDDWRAAMTAVFGELMRVLAPGGFVAFEVGEVRNGSIKLEDAVVPCGRAAGLAPALILINDQKFTKTANCWGVTNNRKGTNTNRIVLFQKPGAAATRCPK